VPVPSWNPDLAREDVPEEAEGIVQRFVVNVTVQISDLEMRMGGWSKAMTFPW